MKLSLNNFIIHIKEDLRIENKHEKYKRRVLEKEKIKKEEITKKD